MNRIKTFEIKIDEYCSLIEDLPISSKSLYHDKKWLEIIISDKLKLMIIKSVNENNDFLAVTPYFSMKKSIFQFYGSPLSGAYTEFLGPIFKPNLSDEIKTHILQSQHLFLEKSANYIEIGFKNNTKIDLQHLEIFKKYNYNESKRNTLILDLKKEKEHIWNNFKSRARNMIRKSEKNDVVVSFYEPKKEWLNNFYLMLQKTYKRQHKDVPHSLNFYLNLSKLINSNLLCISGLRNKKIIASAIFIVDSDRMMYFSGTSNKDGMKYAANSLIQWHAISYGVNNNLSTYDFGGIGISTIDKFKESFGGIKVSHVRMIYRGPFLNFAEKIIRYLRSKGVFNIKIV